MAVFAARRIAVFDRAGNPIGELTGWNVEQPRSFRLNEIEDFTFSIPRYDLVTGTQLLTDNVVDTLLRRDNLIYLQNQQISMRGWAGAIGKVQYGNDRAIVPVYGILSLFHMLEADRIEQDGGPVWTIASRLVSAAQAKQGAHGDLVVGFQYDPSSTVRENLGQYSYEGDILGGLQQLASSTMSEFFVHSRILPSGKLKATLRWGGRYSIDKTSVVISDGVGGNILPGNEVTYTTDTLLNRARLRGTPTELGQYVDYDSVRGVIGDIVPECEIVLDSTADPHHRRREALDLTVGFGYSEDVQRSLALQIQERYLGYYKAFLYAHHGRLGRPYLEGYEWSGPDGRNDKRLTAHYFRSWMRLAYIGERTVIVGSADDDDGGGLEARFDDWQYWQLIAPVSTCVGVATDWSNPDQKYVADGDSGIIWVLEEDLVTKETLLGVTAAGETLKGIATDQTSATLLWALVTTGSAAIVKVYNTADLALVSSWSVAVPTANDISVDVTNGILWMVALDGVGNVQARDINSGVLLVTGEYQSFASGFTNPSGLVVTGGLAYVINSTGLVRFLFAEDGSYAGEKATGVASNGLFVDPAGGTVWVMRTTDGNVDIYRAHIAVSTINAPGSADGAPGFEAIAAGQFVSVVMTSDKAASPHPKNKLVIVYSKGAYVTRSVPTEIGQPDALQKTWVTGEQKVAIVKNSEVRYSESDVVVQGEESRVDDWNPKLDGYAAFGDFALATRRGHSYRVRGWYFKDWDVPDSTFIPDPPDWTQGKQYLLDWLSRTNKERGVQVLRVNNRGGLFRKLVLGGKYTVQLTLQGPPAGISGVLRVLAYTPDESQGVAEVIGEWV